MHKPVLLEETIKLLNIKKGDVILDATLGGGGHSLKLIENLKEGILIALDVDKESIERFKDKLKILGYKTKRKDKSIKEFNKLMILQNQNLTIYLINDNFINLQTYLKTLGIEKVDNIIADLGWSTDQLGKVDGLSYENLSENLDMRFNVDLGVKASDLLNVLGKKELILMFKTYADIYGINNSKLVNEISLFRKQQLFIKVEDLINVINRAFKFESKFKNNEKYKNYSKIFQALRISVNDEINNLKQFINISWLNLKKNGIIEIIVFHSGEENIVKEFFGNLIQNHQAVYVDRMPVRPSVEELRNNLSARSAKLYSIKKLI